MPDARRRERGELETLRQAGVGGPYAIALGPSAFAALTRTVQSNGGYPVMKHAVQQLIDRQVVGARRSLAESQ